MIRAWLFLIGAELRSVARDTAGLIIPIGLPMLILVTNALAVPAEALGAYLLPLVLTIVIATIGVINLPSFLAAYRTSGVLRRLAVTPVRPAAILGAHLVAGLIQITAGVVLAVVVAIAGLGATPPADPVLTVAVLLLATLAMFAVGLLIAAVAPTANAALATGLVVFFAMGAAGGMFGPPGNLPEALARAGTVVPFGAAVRAIGGAWDGAGPDAAPLLSLAVCVLVPGSAAIRFFRWS
ncbi:MAG TPA: ABC transporter permease [Actinoplanes sp.]|nr:ABC transporter permease [Actinoplanes sp.]